MFELKITDAEWDEFLGHFERRRVALGDCGRAYSTSCIHEQGLTCPMFMTSAEFLPQHHAQRQQTLQIIAADEAAGQARVAEMNRQVAGNLGKIIASLQAGDGEDATEETASAS